jgi:uncharacterized protein with FMN-binding domain
MVKNRRCRWSTLLLAPVLLAVAAAMAGCVGLAEEHAEARAVTIDDVDFGMLEEGVYRGSYPGGMNEWRANTVEVTLEPGRVDAIRLVESAELERDDPEYAGLVRRIIEAQSLNVDGISGATLTSKAHLKAIELALEQAHG